MRGQGATEYLVLLAVVLIVALVSVALLGFFPGMASDAQIAQSQAYWRSAQPIAITESAARLDSANGNTYPYLRIKNAGAYPVRLAGIVGADNGKASQFYAGNCGAAGSWENMSDWFYLAPGEEKYFAINGASWYGLPCYWRIFATTGASTTAGGVGGASSVCQNSSSSPGVLDYKSLGFEYIEYLDNGQQITKRQIGKDWVVKCLPPV